MSQQLLERRTQVKVVVGFAVAVALIGLLVPVLLLAQRPSTESFTGEVRNVSDTAIAIVPDDGGAPIYGVLASEVEVEKGDFVTGIYVPDLGVVRVMTIGK